MPYEPIYVKSYNRQNEYILTKCLLGLGVGPGKGQEGIFFWVIEVLFFLIVMMVIQVYGFAKILYI